MKILFATSECAPFSKSGGLADVAFSLPPALKASGNEVAIITPLYKCVKDRFMDQITFVKSFEVTVTDSPIYCGLFRGELDGVTVWFIDNEVMYNRPKLYGYDDDGFRFAFFSRAIISLLFELDFVPSIIHCNDWETAPVILYLKNDSVTDDRLKNIKTVYTIHNIAYQGQYGASELEKTFGLPGGWYQGGLGYEFEGRHDINLMKGAMMMADAVSTVSPTYAKEIHLPEFGMGLQGVADMVEYKTYGILNGITMSHYDPEIDPRIPANFSSKNMAGKAICKEEIQKKFGLRTEPHWPLFCSVARLVEQKGIELVKEILPNLMKMGVQLILFGQGEQRYVDYFNWAKENWPGQIGFSDNYSEDVAAQVFAGCDFYLMPSRFEPCGLSQMMAMRYGTIPVVHETGGLKDSVRPYSSFDGIGDGFSFRNYDSKALYLACLAAVREYFGEENVFETLRMRGMTKDFSWTKSAEQYEKMYSDISSDGDSGEEISFDDAFKQLKKAYMKLEKANVAERMATVPDDYHLAVQVHIEGRGEGLFYIEVTKDSLTVEPYTFHEADAEIEASFDNLLGIANGTVSDDKLFMNGQLKISGNISRSFELKKILTPKKTRRSRKKS